MKIGRQASLALALISTVYPAIARADRNIVVDGSRADWAGATTCFTVNVTGGGFTFNYACLENNNAAGSAGNLFGVVGAAANFPAGSDVWGAFTLDTNQDCTINDSDDIYAFYFPAGGGNTSSWMGVFSGTSQTLRRSYTTTANCGGAGANNGWSAVKSGNTVEFSIAYGCIGLSYNGDYRLSNMILQEGAVTYLTSPNAFYDGTSDTLTNIGAPPDVSTLTAVAMQSQVMLNWNNPATTHRGVVVLQSSVAAPNTAPTKGTVYAVGNALGNAKVVYADNNGSSVATFTNTALTNGTRYFYKVYNHHQCQTYATGNVPSASGIFAEPTSRVAPAPAWCYSTGFSDTIQPVTDVGATVYSAGQIGAITANVTAPANAATDGTELFRPTTLGGPVQNRFPITALAPFAVGKYVITGDQTGRVYNINAATGATVWLANGGLSFGDSIQAQPVVQLYNASQTSAAFKAAHPNEDLIFFATRNNPDPLKTYSTTNKVVAINSKDGSVAWTYFPGDLDIVSGGMMVDYQHDNLWVAARAGPGATPSLRVVSTLNGAEKARLALGDIDTGVVRDYGVSPSPADDQAYVVNNAGTVYGLDLVGLNVVWSTNLSPMSTYPFPTGQGFIASVKGAGGSVARYSVNGTIVTLVWTTPIANPSGVRVDYVGQKVFVGSSDGKLHQLDVGTGADQKQINMGSQVGMPTIDPSVSRLHVGLNDGRLCAFQLPLP